MIDQHELEREEAFWDKVGKRWLTQEEAELVVDDPRKFLSGSSVAFEYLERQLGDVSRMKVLDYGCGSGWLGCYLALRGATVEGFDISGKLVELAEKRARANNVSHRTRFRKMIAERLEYSDDSFDMIIGISILHHISLDEGASELRRILKPGGRAYFIEPLGENKVFDFIRSRVFRVHHGEVRTVDAEHPLTYANIRAIGSSFKATAWREFQLLEMIARVTGDSVTRWLGLRALDGLLLNTFPSLRKHTRLVVVTYSK